MKKLYLFEKSGSIVQIVSTHPSYGGRDVTVARIDTGKMMTVHSNALIPLISTFACPYCDRELTEQNVACCKENHVIPVFVTDDSNRTIVSVPKASLFS